MRYRWTVNQNGGNFMSGLISLNQDYWHVDDY